MSKQFIYIVSGLVFMTRLLSPIENGIAQDILPVVTKPVIVASNKVEKSIPTKKVSTKPSQALTELQTNVKRMVAEEFTDAPVMVHIADAESDFIPTNKNPNSTAKGVFQILDSTWKGAKCTGNVMDARDNIACARVLYNQSKTRPWNPSKETWGKITT